MNLWTDLLVEPTLVTIADLRTRYIKQMQSLSHSYYKNNKNVNHSDYKATFFKAYPNFADVERIISCAVSDLTISDLATMAHAVGSEVKFKIESQESE